MGASAGTAALHRQPLRASKRQTRKTRRERAAKAARNRQSETERVLATSEYELLRACGWDILRRELRTLEPPTRSGESGSSRKNGWYMSGDAEAYGIDPKQWEDKADSQKIVPPVHSAVYLWWITLETNEQDEVADLSYRCSKRDDGLVRSDPDPMELLRDMPADKRTVVLGGEDPRQWGKR